MGLSEFDLIGRYFSHLGPSRADVLQGVGDDCALLRPPEGTDLALSTDTLLAGRHFFPDVDPESLGHKALAVNLSDLAAAGAAPAWATLALSLAAVDEAWLEAFARGFGHLAEHAGISLVGGDTTRGPLAITVQVLGFLPRGQGLGRAGARAGDRIYVSGCLGDAALALRQFRQGGAVDPGPRERLERPRPRTELGIGLRGLASACIDVSDGLVADLGHLCERSGVGAVVELADLPLSAEMTRRWEGEADWALPLAGGDDYELCFTLSPDRARLLEPLADGLGLPLTCIGRIETGSGVRCRLPDDAWLSLQQGGYDHFQD